MPKGLPSKFIAWVRGSKNGELVIAGAAALVVALIWLAIGGIGGKEQAQLEQVQATQGDVSGIELEDRLANILSCIHGVGSVDVMITFAGSGEIVPVFNQSSSENVTEDRDQDGSLRKSTDTQIQTNCVTTDAESQVVVVEERMPEIVGVLVIAQGADSLEIKMNLIKAVQTALGIPPDKVEVFAKEQIYKEAQ